MEQPYTRTDQTWCQRTFSKLSAGSLRSSIFTLISTTIGAGLLALPFAVDQNGLISGIIMMTLSAISYNLYYKLLVSICLQQKTYDYIQLTQKLYGQLGRRLTQFSMSILTFGSIALYMVLIGDLLMSIIVSIGLLDSTHNQTIRIIILAVLTIVVWFPLCVPKQITSLAYASALSLFALLYVTVVVIIQAPQYINNFSDFQNGFTLVEFNHNFLQSVGIFFFSFDATQIVPVILKELQRRSQKRMNKVIDRGLVTMTILFFILGFVGYFSYLGDVPELIIFRPTIDGSSKAHDWVMVVARVMTCIYVTMAVPMNFCCFRLSVQHFLSGPVIQYNSKRYYTVTIISLFLMCLIAILIPEIIFYFNILGGFFSTGMAFFLPMLLYWRTGSSIKKKIIITVFSCFLTGLGVACGVDEIMRIIIN